VFLQAKLGAPSVFSGQPVRLDVTLYAAAPVNGFTWTDVPSLPGLWAEDLPVDPGADRRVVTMNGRQYNAYPVARKLVVPTRAGSLVIQPFSAQIQMRRATHDPFASFFSLGGLVNIVRRTGPVKLDVKPLPEAGRPAEAETVYWDDLRRNPGNGWALYGAWQALLAQGKRDEAAVVERRFRKAWERADVTLTASRFK